MDIVGTLKINIATIHNRLLLSVAGSGSLERKVTNLKGSASRKRQWVNTATEKQQPKRYA